MGYALIGLAAGTEAGMRGVLIYMVIYVFMSAGTFACIIAMRRQGRAVEQISDLAGLARTDPGLALAMAIFMFSMAGIPPLSGLLRQALRLPRRRAGGLWTLAVIGVLTSVVGAFYYLRIIKVMYFDAPEAAFDPRGRVAVLRRRGDRPVHHVLLRLPGAVRRRRGGGGESPVRVTPASGVCAGLPAASTPPPTSARRLPRAGEPEGLAVLALRQTAGRGSRGRNWAVAGGQPVSLRAAAPAGRAGRGGPLGAARRPSRWPTRCAALLPDPALLALKWPNDVLLDGRKVAGILLDARRQGGRSHRLAGDRHAASIWRTRRRCRAVAPPASPSSPSRPTPEAMARRAA